MNRACLWYGLLVVEIKLLEISFGGCRVNLSIFTLVLALFRNALEGLDRDGRSRRVANEFVNVACVSTQVSPRNHLLRTDSALNTEMESFVEEESLLVSFGGKRINLSVFVLVG